MMTPIDLGALVVIAGRVLGQDLPAVLDLMDVAAAEAALAEAESAGPGPDDRAAALLGALIRRRPLTRGNEQAAVLATVTFLAVNGRHVDLEPAEVTAAMVADLAGGRRSAADLAGWLSPRIAGYRAGLTHEKHQQRLRHRLRRYRCMDGCRISGAPPGARET